MGLHLYASPGGIHFTYQEARVRLFRFQMQMYFTIVQGQSIPKVTPPKASGLDGNGVFADVLVRCLVRRGHWPWPTGAMLPPGNTTSHKEAEEAKAYSQVLMGRLPSSSLGATPWASKPQGPESYCPKTSVL